MTSIQLHKEQIKEHVQEINDAITIGLEKRPATIALHTSACSISLLEMYLHKIRKISIGTTIKHEWFKAPKPEQKIVPLAERKIETDFPLKNELFSLMYIIEEHRNKLIYGKPTNAAIKEVFTSFQKIHAIIKEKLKELGEEIE